MAKKTMDKLLEEALVPVENHPYQVPDNWVWVRLGHMAEYKKGPFGSSITKAMFVPKGVNTYKVYEQGTAIKKDKNYGSYYISEEKYQELKGFTVTPNDLIVSCAGTVGEIYQLPKDIEIGIINQALMRVKVNEKINLKYYLWYFDESLKKDITGKSKGTAIKNIPPLSILKDMEFALPPIEEQQRIVTKIKSLFSKIDEAKELIEESRQGFENRKASILSKAFRGELTKKWREENSDVGFKEVLIERTDNECSGKFYILPKTWRWIQLKDIILEMQTKKPSYIDKDFFHYIDIDSIDNKKQQIRQMKIVEVNKAPSRASRHVEKGDVLISLVRPYLKNIALVEYDQDDMIASTGFYVCKIKPIYESKLLYYYLKTDGFTNLLTSLMRGDNSPSVRISEFPQQFIPYIPVEEQKEIVRILDNLLSFESEIEELTQLEDQIELLKKSILAKAFRGELGTNDPTEESAIELLKEILKEKIK